MDFDSQAKILEQRRNRYLQQQDAQAPDGQMVGGRYIAANPLEYLAAGLRGYGGFKGEQLANQELTDLQAKKQDAIAKALRTFGEKANPSQAGTGATNLVNDALPPEMQIGAQPALAPRKPDMYGAYQSLADSGVSDLQKASMQGFLQMPQIEAQQQEREDARTFRQQEAQAAREARAQELKMRSEDQRIGLQERLAAQRELQQMQIDARKDMQRMIAASRPAPQAPQAQTLQTENGILERRGNEWVPITVGGKPVMPKGSGSNAALPEVAKAKDATDAIALLQQAAPLVRGATGSGIGAGVDWLAGQVGTATKGAENIAQLKTIAGMLVSKMPKMSGPQSDKDVLLYKEMAGNIGDPNVPTALKEKAMQTIMEIQARYAGVQPPALNFEGAQQKQVNPQDAQAMEWARANPNDPRAKAIMQRLGAQ
jgi:hypothetical protein